MINSTSMSPEEIKPIVKAILEEAAEYSKLVYININFNMSGSVSTVNQTGKPQDPPTNPPGGNG